MNNNEIKDETPFYSLKRVEEEDQPQQLDNARVHGRPRMRSTNEATKKGIFEELRLRDSPSPTNNTPWNNITLVFKGTGYSTIDAFSVFNQLRRQIDPHKQFLGTPKPEEISFDDSDYDEIPMELALAHHMIQTEPAVQIRIRQIKIWAMKTKTLSVNIFKPREEDGGTQSVVLVRNISEPIDGTKTSGCKLPQHMRDNIYYSLDYANQHSKIMQYSTENRSVVSVQFNAEWKAMTCTRSEFVEEIHKERFKKALQLRTKLSPLTLRPKKEDDQAVSSEHSLSQIPSKVIQEWSNDPIFINYKKEKVEAIGEAQIKEEKVVTFADALNSDPIDEEHTACAPVPVNSRVAEEDPLQTEEFRNTQIRLINHTIATLDILTEQLNDSRRSKSISPPPVEDIKGTPPESGNNK